MSDGRILPSSPIVYPKNERNFVFDQLDKGRTRRILGIRESRKKMEPELAAAPQSDHSCANEIENRPIKNKKSRWLLANEITF